MNIQTLYSTALAGHITGLTIMAGTTFSGYIVSRQFWKQLQTDKAKGIAINTAVAKLPILFGIGFLLLVVSGVTMMAITHGAFGEQLWFRVKFGLILFIVINGLVFGRRQGIQLRRYLSEGADDEQKRLTLKRNFNLFYLLQLAAFLLIYVLSVFK